MTRFVLSVDGGGIRGVGPAQMLVHLDTALKLARKKPVAELFDLMVGTSTGAIVVAALAASTHPSTQRLADPREIVKIYTERGGEIFPKSLLTLLPGIFRQKYSSDPIRRILTETFGDLRLRDLRRNFMATFYSMGPGKPRTVFAHGGPNYPDTPGSDFYGDILLREAVQASTSAPTYFNPTEVRDPNGRAISLEDQGSREKWRFIAIDGGVFANTPAVCAYVEARKLFPQEDIVVVSVGCGEAETTYPSVKSWGILEWVSPKEGVPLLKAVSHGQSDSANHQMVNLLGDSHFRFQFSLKGISKELDDASEDNIKRLTDAADLEMTKPGALTNVARLVQLAPPEEPPQP